MELHERLKLARINAGFATAKDAAKRVGVPYGTYSGHESGSRGVKKDDLALYARAFNVPLIWLSFGIEDLPNREARYAVVAGVVGNSGDITLFDPENTAEADIIIMPPLPLKDMFQAVLKVEGNALSGFAPDGSYLYIESSDNYTFPSDSSSIDYCLDRHSFCFVRRDDDWVGIIGVPRKGPDGTYYVERFLLPTLLKAEIKVASPIIAVVMKDFGDQFRELVAHKASTTRNLSERLGIPPN